MKAETITFKSLEIYLAELKPFILNGTHLEKGKPFKKFGELRSREILANWLLCAVLNFEYKSSLQFKICTDPNGGDGLIYDIENKMSYPTEHILVSTTSHGNDVQSLILKSIEKKQNKGGKAYASGKIL